MSLALRTSPDRLGRIGDPTVAWRMKMNCRTSTFLAAGFIGLLTFGNVASAGQLSREQILEALTAKPTVPSLTDRLRSARSLTLDHYAAASVQPKPAVDLEVYFDFNSATITGEAEPQLRELGAALADPSLRGATISIGGHTDAVGGDAFNKKLSERRAASIKQYLVDNFSLSETTVRTVGYGKSRPKNKKDLNAPENRRVEVVNLAPQAQAAR
jgi:outer membrane protein OmpA-like peptidoglycan-associated protein